MAFKKSRWTLALDTIQEQSQEKEVKAVKAGEVQLGHLFNRPWPASDPLSSQSSATQFAKSLF